MSISRSTCWPLRARLADGVGRLDHLRRGHAEQLPRGADGVLLVGLDAGACFRISADGFPSAVLVAAASRRCSASTWRCASFSSLDDVA